MNVPLLLEIKAHILAEPDKFRMDTWTCGTAHCIAGWALELRGFKIVNPTAWAAMQTVEGGGSPGHVAARLLDLQSEDDYGEMSSDRLFIDDYWPEDFAERYGNAESRQERAIIAAERIDHFIATNGEE
jgi:hypothetical protein